MPVLDGIPEFFQSFYQISDTADAHTKYLSYFTKDATFIIAAKRSNGHDGMLFPSPDETRRLLRGGIPVLSSSLD